jgi:hypothetical protein
LQKSAKVPEDASSAAKIDVCALLARTEIQVVQNQPVEETKPSAQPSGAFLMLQCFYRTTTFAKSVTLAMAMPDPAKPSVLTPREYWNRQFHPREQAEKEKEKDEPAAGKAKTRNETEEEREKELGKPRVIDGLGEEAYWVGNLITAALYVLKREVFLRISVGGVRDESERIEKSKTLAHAALKRV